MRWRIYFISFLNVTLMDERWRIRFFFIWLLYLCPFFIKLYTCTDKLAHDNMFQRSWNTWKLSPHITQAKPRWLRSCPVQTSSSCEQEEQQMLRWSLTKLTLLVLESLPFQKRRASEKYHSIFLDTAVPLSLRLSEQPLFSSISAAVSLLKRSWWFQQTSVGFLVRDELQTVLFCVKVRHSEQPNQPHQPFP